MLSKEEIEKAKNEGYEIIRDFRKATTEFTKDILPKKANAIKTLIEGIEQLETENKELKADKQRLIEKLEEKLKYKKELIDLEYQQYKEYYSRTGDYPAQTKLNVYKLTGEKNQIEYILEILKGEKNGIRYTGR